MPIGGIDIERAEGNHRDHDAQLDRNDDGVDDSRFFDALVAKRRGGGDDENRGQIKHGAGPMHRESDIPRRERRRAEPVRNDIDPIEVEELDEIPEFASMVPVAGSAYAYSYATLGELIAWFVGWNLILEYSMSSPSVA